MNTPTHTRGPWKAQRAEGWRNTEIFACDKDETYICAINEDNDEREANARLIAAAPTQHAEMLRFLPVLERAEADPEIWERLTRGTGIATLNAYRAAIASATGART